MFAFLIAILGLSLASTPIALPETRALDWRRVSITLIAQSAHAEASEPAIEISEEVIEPAIEIPPEPAAETPKETGRAASRVPFYSQFTDITDPAWKKIGCGIVSLAMVIDYYKPGTVAVPTLLEEGIKADAYLSNAGWTYAGLIRVARPYGLDGESHDFGGSDTARAFAAFTSELLSGPVIASVHYKFDPTSTIPHLVVINRIEGDLMYYNDPAAQSGNLAISTADFLKAWKKRFIVIRPAESPRTLL
jgi:predicted double-glycine peptidase